MIVFSPVPQSDSLPVFLYSESVTLICEHCGDWFSPTNRRQRFCCDDCRVNEFRDPQHAREAERMQRRNERWVKLNRDKYWSKRAAGLWEGATSSEVRTRQPLIKDAAYPLPLPHKVNGEGIESD
jgi:hypothetical protein